MEAEIENEGILKAKIPLLEEEMASLQAQLTEALDQGKLSQPSSPCFYLEWVLLRLSCCILDCYVTLIFCFVIIGTVSATIEADGDEGDAMVDRMDSLDDLGDLLDGEEKEEGGRNDDPPLSPSSPSRRRSSNATTLSLNHSSSASRISSTTTSSSDSRSPRDDDQAILFSTSNNSLTSSLTRSSSDSTTSSVRGGRPCEKDVRIGKVLLGQFSMSDPLAFLHALDAYDTTAHRSGAAARALVAVGKSAIGKEVEAMSSSSTVMVVADRPTSLTSSSSSSTAPLVQYQSMRRQSESSAVREDLVITSLASQRLVLSAIKVLASSSVTASRLLGEVGACDLVYHSLYRAANVFAEHDDGRLCGEVLVKLLQAPSNGPRLTDAGVCEVLIRAKKNTHFQSEAEGSDLACIALACINRLTLTGGEDARVRLVAVGGLPYVVDRMITYLEDPGVRLEGCRALVTLAEQDGRGLPYSPETIDAPKAVIGCMQKAHRGQKTVKVNGCWAMTLLAEGGHLEGLEEAGAAAVLLSTLQDWARDKSVQLAGTEALHALLLAVDRDTESSSPVSASSMSQALVTAGALRRLCRALFHFDDIEGIRQHALEALYLMAKGSLSNSKALLEEGATRRVTSAMHLAGPTDIKSQLVGCRTLGCLAKAFFVPPAAAAVVEQEGDVKGRKDPMHDMGEAMARVMATVRAVPHHSDMVDEGLIALTAMMPIVKVYKDDLRESVKPFLAYLASLFLSIETEEGGYDGQVVKDHAMSFMILLSEELLKADMGRRPPRLPPVPLAAGSLLGQESRSPPSYSSPSSTTSSSMAASPPLPQAGQRMKEAKAYIVHLFEDARLYKTLVLALRNLTVLMKEDSEGGASRSHLVLSEEGMKIRGQVLKLCIFLVNVIRVAREEHAAAFAEVHACQVVIGLLKQVVKERSPLMKVVTTHTTAAPAAARGGGQEDSLPASSERSPYHKTFMELNLLCYNVLQLLDHLTLYDSNNAQHVYCSMGRDLLRGLADEEEEIMKGEQQCIAVRDVQRKAKTVLHDVEKGGGLVADLKKLLGISVGSLLGPRSSSLSAGVASE